MIFIKYSSKLIDFIFFAIDGEGAIEFRLFPSDLMVFNTLEIFIAPHMFC